MADQGRRSCRLVIEEDVGFPVVVILPRNEVGRVAQEGDETAVGTERRLGGVLVSANGCRVGAPADERPLPRDPVVEEEVRQRGGGPAPALGWEPRSRIR